MTGTRDDNAWDRRQPTIGRKVAIGAAVGVGAVILFFIMKAIIPRWWSQRVGNVVDGSLTVGALFGLFIGFVFMVVPLLTAWAVIHWCSERRTWKGWLGWLGVVALAAAPNLMTLNIVFGGGNGEHAGDRTLDTEAPGFRVWSVVGAVVGLLAVGWLIYLSRSRGRSRRKASEMRDELHTRRSGEDNAG